uniref:Uncharacterized protein n=1 Tax=Avena sativa TaxID=4498 RepID=A0ACD5VFQ3_AVESA
MAAAPTPSAPPLEPSKPLPPQAASTEPAPLAYPLEQSKPMPEGAQDFEAGVRGQRYDRLPCCGLGIGWVLFIIGFFLGAIPWYAGAIMLCFYRGDHREKPGLIACAVAAVIGTILIILATVLPTEVHVY